MAVFPETPRTLLKSLSALAEEEEESRWARFVELYEPAVREFIRLQDSDIPAADADDLVQETMMRLVPALREGRFDPSKGRFRTFLAVTVRRLMIDRLRALSVRPSGASVPIDEVDPVAETPSSSALLDMKWRLARHHAAVERVFSRSALSAQSREVYLLSEVEGLPDREISARLGLACNAIRRIRSRVKKMIAALEDEYL